MGELKWSLRKGWIWQIAFCDIYWQFSAKLVPWRMRINWTLVSAEVLSVRTAGSLNFFHCVERCAFTSLASVVRVLFLWMPCCICYANAKKPHVTMETISWAIHRGTAGSPCRDQSMLSSVCALCCCRLACVCFCLSLQASAYTLCVCWYVRKVCERTCFSCLLHHDNLR